MMLCYRIGLYIENLVHFDWDELALWFGVLLWGLYLWFEFEVLEVEFQLVCGRNDLVLT